MNAEIRKHVVYRGRVQGVGFRYTCCDLARSFTLVGYVRNLPDGDVELEAQGQAGEVDRFLADIADTMRGNIHRATERDVPLATGETRFEIRH